MAAVTSRFVARLLTSLHTTPSLHSTSTRAISSFKGLQTLAQPGRIPSEEVEEIGFMREHLDAISFWNEEAERMSQLRFLPCGKETGVHEIFSEQVVELLEDLVESGALDPRTGWLAESHH